MDLNSRTSSVDNDIMMAGDGQNAIKARLEQVQKKVKKLTIQALKQQQTNATASTATTPFMERNNNYDDPNASFHLGMELFGQEVCDLERDVQGKLVEMERELQNIAADLGKQKGNTNIGDDEEEDDTDTFRTAQEMEQESEQLVIKIRFLKECSIARGLLDESVTLSTPALAPNEVPDYLTAARKLVESHTAGFRAEQILEEQAQLFESADTTSPDDASLAAATTSQKSILLLAPAYDMVDEIRSSQRRQLVELKGMATTIWHQSVSLTANTITVCGGGSGGEEGNNNNNSLLRVAYDVLDVLDNGDGNSSGGNTSDTTTVQQMLRKFTASLYRDVLAPIIIQKNNNKQRSKVAHHHTFHESDDRATSSLGGGGSSLGIGAGSSTSKKGRVRRLEWTCEEVQVNSEVETTSDGGGLETWKETLAFIQRIVVFVADHVVLQRPDLCQFLALRLFGKPSGLPSSLNLEALGIENCRLGADDTGLLLEPLVQALEGTCVPQCLKASELGQLRVQQQQLATFLDPFLDALEAKNLLPVEGKAQLASFTSSFEQMYVDNRRCILLNGARDMLLNNDYHNTVVVGEDVHQNRREEELGLADGMAVFKLHKASVSDTASRIMTLCRQIMDEAVEQQKVSETSPLAVLPGTLYQTAREVLDLFRAIIPVTHGHEVANVPRTAAVLHNDCVFLAHHCLTLGLEYREKFPEPQPDDTRGKLLKQTCMFVDMVPLFRDLADRSLGDMLDKQAKQLYELVGERITLMGEALRSDEILVEWSDAETAMAAGHYHLRHLTQAWTPILSYDILNRSMCYLIDVMFTLFLDQVAKATDISSNACQFVHTLFQKATQDLEVLLEGDRSGSRIWDRFSAVGKFMDMSIADIQVALADGVFCNVTGPELSKLVRSCFDDSPKRQVLLKALASNQ